MAESKPVLQIEKAVDKKIYIKLKGKRHAIKAVLRSFDEHLNLFLEDTIEVTKHYDREKNALVNEENELDSIILRGDNVVLITLDEKMKEGEEPASSPPPAPAN
nr:LSM domain-containing protein [Candidatus Sigynarchaeota archaeon]